MAKRNRKLAGLPKPGRPLAAPHGATLPLGPIHGVQAFTRHCAERFRQRTGFNKDDAKLRERLETWLHKSRPIEPLSNSRLLKLLNNGCRPTLYRIVGDPRRSAYIFTIESGTLVTVYPLKGRNWDLTPPP